ncbi:hypothetical protein [Rhodococcus sp. SJ-2]
MVRHTLDFGSPLPPGWTTLDEKHRSQYWDRFTDRFGFRPRCRSDVADACRSVREMDLIVRRHCCARV